MEAKLRPTKGLAWNVAVGGFAPPNPTGRALSEETKNRISEAALLRNSLLTEEEHKERFKGMTGKKLSPEWCESISKARKKLVLWKAARVDKNNLAKAELFYEAWKEKQCGFVALSKHFGLARDSLQALVDHFRNGWIPSQDPEYLAWRSSYLASQDAANDLIKRASTFSEEEHIKGTLCPIS